MKSEHYTLIKITKLPGHMVEIEASVSAEKIAEMRLKALAKMKQTIVVDGFRKGNVPDNIVLEKVGEMKILEEAAEMALSETYPLILEDEKLDAIGRPEVSITKLGVGSELVFKIKTSLAPEVKLAEYTKIAEELRQETRDMKYEVTEAEIDAVVLDVRKNVAHAKLHEKENKSPDDHSHGEIKDEDLPEVNDEFLKAIGGFPSVDDLRTKIKENMIREKEAKAKDKRRTEILEAIMKDSTLQIPQVIIDAEIEKMLGQFKDDIARSGVVYEEYLKHIKKTEDEIKKEWLPTAEKRAKSQLILTTIAREQDIYPEEALIKKEMEQILSQQKDLDRFRVRMFVDMMLTNELVFQFLEK